MAIRRYQNGGIVTDDDTDDDTDYAPRAIPRATLVAPPAPGRTPAVTTGPATIDISKPLQLGTDVPGLGTKFNGGLITHYGFPGDKWWDSSSGKAQGDRDNLLQPLQSVALSVDQRQRMFPNAQTRNFPNTSTGLSFQMGNRTYIDDDTAPESGRIDVFNPRFPGLDKGVSTQTAAQRASQMLPGYAPAIYNKPQPTALGVAAMGGYSGGPQRFQAGGPVLPKPDPEYAGIAPDAPSGPPSMAPGLGTVGGAPQKKPNADPVVEVEQPKAETKKNADPVIEVEKQPAAESGPAPTPKAQDPVVEVEKPAEKPAAVPAPTTAQPVAAATREITPGQAPTTTDQAQPKPDQQPAQEEQRPPVLSVQDAQAQARSQLTDQENSDADAISSWQHAHPRSTPPQQMQDAYAKREAITQKLLDASSGAPTTDTTGTTTDQQTTTTETQPEVEAGATKGTTLSGTHTIFGLNYDQSIDQADNGRGFFTDNQGRNYNTRDPRVKVVAVPGDVLNATFGTFLQQHSDGSYTLINSPAARKIYQAVESAHVEVKDAQGNAHKFAIGDVQAALATHRGRVLDFSYGAAKDMGYTDNGHVDYQIVKGDGTPYPVPDLSSLPQYAGSGKEGPYAGHTRGELGFTFGAAPAENRAALREPEMPPSRGAEAEPYTPPSRSQEVASAGRGEFNLGSILAASALAQGGGKQEQAQPQAQAPPEEDTFGPMVKALVQRGFTPAQAQSFAQSSQAITPHEPIKTSPGQPPPAPSVPRLPAPTPQLTAPSAPGVEAAQTGLADAIKALQQLGFKKTQAQSMLKNIPGKNVSELVANALKVHQQGKGGAIPKPRPTSAGGATAAAPPAAPPAAPSAPEAQPAQAAAPIAKPPTPEERRAQVAAHAQQAIADKRPMHISYISAPKEAARYPTRDTRMLQYEESSPEARLLGTTTGQLVGHSLIPVETKVTKEGEPYIMGLSTNAMANNHKHINDKLAAMGRKTPYLNFDQKFINDVEGYWKNLAAGHTATGQGTQAGTEEHPVHPDPDHLPHQLTRNEADFIGLVLNNTKAFAKDNQSIRELARAHGRLITEAGETNRMRHDIEQQHPGWATGIVNGRYVKGAQVLEPSIRSFKSGLVHEVHPTEETLPATIRPGVEYQQLTKALHRAMQRGRPDIAMGASLHHNLQHNSNINRIEREFSEGRISEEQARKNLEGLGEDPDEYRFIQGSGGLITPYEEDPEAITPEEHGQLKSNLRKQWLGGKMNVEDYRRKAAEVPLPSIASRATKPPEKEEQPAEETEPAPKPVSKKPAKAAAQATEPEPEATKPAAPKPEPPKPKATKPARAKGDMIVGEKAHPEEQAEPTEEAPKEPPAAPGVSTAPVKPEEPAEPEPEEGPPPAPTEAAPKKKGAKTKEEKETEERIKAEAAVDRNDIDAGDQRKINRLQKLAKGWIKQAGGKLHDLSAIAHLSGQKNFKSNDLNKADIGEHFDSMTEGGNARLDYEKPEHRDIAAHAIMHDIMHALAGTKHAKNQEGKPSTAYGWYDRAVRKTIKKVAQLAPEILTDPEHALAFKLALAVTSQGQDVHPNAESAWNIYRYWRQHGELPEDRKVFGGGPKAEQMEINLQKLNDLWDEHGAHNLQRILMQRGKVSDLKDKYGLDFGTEKVGNTVNGAMFLGPKIGAFFSNLNGDFWPTTMDLWFSRTLNRLAGNMFKFKPGSMLNDKTVKGKLQKAHVNEMEDLLNKGQASAMTPEREAKIREELTALRGTPEDKLDRKTASEVAPELHAWGRERHAAYQKQQTINGVKRSYHPALKTRENVLGKKLDEGIRGLSDAPRNASERDNWRAIMENVEGKLKDSGVKMTNADKQALLWFVEKHLFMHAGSPQKAAADYLDAAYMLHHKVKTGAIAGLDAPIAKLARRSRELPTEIAPDEEEEAAA